MNASVSYSKISLQITTIIVQKSTERHSSFNADEKLIPTCKHTA